MSPPYESSQPGTVLQQEPCGKGKGSGEMQYHLTEGKNSSLGKRCSEQLNKKQICSHLPEIQVSLQMDAEKQSLVMSFFKIKKHFL